MSGPDEGGGSASAPSVIPAGPVKWTAYLDRSGVRYRTRLVGVPRVRQYGPPFARHAGTVVRTHRPCGASGVTGDVRAPDRADKRMAGGERDAAGCSA